MTQSLVPSPMDVSISIRDPATAGDPVALVTRHLDAGARVTVHDPEGHVPTFALVRRGAGVAVQDGDGASLATYADVEAALRCGLTRWPPYLVAAAEAAVDAAMQPRRPRRPLARMVARLNRTARHAP